MELKEVSDFHKLVRIEHSLRNPLSEPHYVPIMGDKATSSNIESGDILSCNHEPYKPQRVDRIDNYGKLVILSWAGDPKGGTICYTFEEFNKQDLYFNLGYVTHRSKQLLEKLNK